MKNQNYNIEIECSTCKKIFEIRKLSYDWKKSRGQISFCCSRPCSDIAVGKINSIIQKGIPKSEFQKLKLIENAKVNPNYGMSGKNHKPESCNKISENSLGKIMSEESREKIRIATLGLLNHNYIDGRSYGNYCRLFTPKLREEVRIRDSYTCRLCGKIQKQELLEINKLLSVHHIHYDKQNPNPDLITLCRSCNTRVNRKDMRKFYEGIFMNMLNKRSLLFWTRRNITT